MLGNRKGDTDWKRLLRRLRLTCCNRFSHAFSMVYGRRGRAISAARIAARPSFFLERCSIVAGGAPGCGGSRVSGPCAVGSGVVVTPMTLDAGKEDVGK